MTYTKGTSFKVSHQNFNDVYEYVNMAAYQIELARVKNTKPVLSGALHDDFHFEIDFKPVRIQIGDVAHEVRTPCGKAVGIVLEKMDFV